MELADDTTKVSSNRNFSGFVERLFNGTVSIKHFFFKTFLCLDVKLTKQIMETETETF